MELQYHGGNCVSITTKKATLVVDDNLDELGLKPVTKSTDISLRTSKKIPARECRFSIDMPGEYEIAGVAINGIAAQSHMDAEGKNPTIYTVAVDDFKVAVLGHIISNLDDEQLEGIGVVDVLIVPVGGNGYTLDGAGALQLIKKIEPKVVIPTHYAGKGLKYEVPQQTLAEALKGLAMEPAETVAKYKPATAEMTDTTKLIILERQ